MMNLAGNAAAFNESLALCVQGPILVKTSVSWQEGFALFWL